MNGRFFTVWGMHRSGTSLLAAAMRVFGAELTGKSIEPDRYNPKGYFENTDLMRLNDAMLAELGQKWHSLAAIGPEQYAVLEGAGYVDQAIAFLKAEAAKAPLVLLKDPRLCRVGAIWRQAFARLDITPWCVVPWRDPLAVASSLRVRSQNVKYPSPAADLRYGLLLWLTYTQGAMVYTSGCPRILINYDQFLRTPAATMEKAAAVFGLPINEQALEEFCLEFVDVNLNHNAETLPGVTMPQQVRELVARLEESRDVCPCVEHIWPVTDEEQTLAALLDEANRRIRAHAGKMASIHTEVCVLTGECKRMALELQLLKGQK